MSRNRRNKRETRKFINNYSKHIKLILPIFFILICLVVITIKKYITHKEALSEEVLNNEIFNANIELSEEEKAEIHEESKRDIPLNLSVVGNILCQNEILSSVQNKDYDFSTIFESIKKHTNSSDITISPIETNFVNKAYSGNISYNSPISLAKEIKNIGVDIALLSNNHSLDYGTDGYIETISNIKEIGVETIGLKTIENERNIVIKEYRGIKIAFLAYTYGVNKKEEGYENYISIINKEDISNDIELAKQQGAEYIIAGVHWGNANGEKITKEQKELSEFLVNSGIDIILGNHPSSIQKMETRVNNEGKDVLVVYSLGNFISSETYGNANLGMILNIELIKLAEDDKVYLNKVTYIPTYMQDNGGDSENRYKILDIKEEISNYENGMNNINEKTYKKLKQGLVKIKELING